MSNEETEGREQKRGGNISLSCWQKVRSFSQSSPPVMPSLSSPTKYSNSTDLHELIAAITTLSECIRMDPNVKMSD